MSGVGSIKETYGINVHDGVILFEGAKLKENLPETKNVGFLVNLSDTANSISISLLSCDIQLTKEIQLPDQIRGKY